MKKKHFFNGILAIVLSLSMVFGSLVPASAAQRDLKFEQIENSAIDNSLVKAGAKVTGPANQTYDNDDIVRVSIFLKEKSVVDAGYSTEDILNNSKALKQLKAVKNNQDKVEKAIEKAIKKDLDVKQNLALVTNAISAEVKFGDLQKIATVSDVKAVVIETQYLPEADLNISAPDMAAVTGNVTGSSDAWKSGYKGEGARIAIIDTGLDIDHQSFDNDAFLYALAEDAQATEKTNNNSKGILGKIIGAIKSLVKTIVDLIREYIFGKGKKNTDTLKKLTDKYGLLTADEIAKALPNLNVYKQMGGNISAADLVVSNKIPFAFNYVDGNTNVRHIYDTQGEHGSHVSGIATANRYIKKGDQFVDALSEVGVAGNAPEAQIIVMKVFGQGGGAYDSDYMAAIEDAIVLGCDSVNLSLGGGYAGASTSSAYQDVLNKLTESDTVVVMSAGNSGAWAEQTFWGNLYIDGINYDTAGSPGSFANSFAVASIENVGTFGYSFVLNGKRYGFNETEGYGNEQFVTLANGSSATYEYVFIEGFGEEADYEGLDVEGKIVFVSRGTTSFYEKANIAVEHGAIATVVYNNQPGVINMNLTGYEYSAPAVSITQAAGAEILAASKNNTGKLTVDTEKSVLLSEDDYYTMSDFSSWGVPGNLSMKPEIVAPGGMILSVAGTNDEGGGIDQYELMSGTSMAAPQITGMTAVLKRYLELNKVSFKGNQLTNRALAQSLLMSTATPMTDADGEYYSVLQQGSGLGNVYDAMNADSIITMGSDATVSANDGKVKVELGDDPARKGVYEFSFVINNISDNKVTYKLSADVFTQAPMFDEYDNLLASGQTMEIPATVKFTVDKKAATSVTVKKNKSVTVNVQITLDADTKDLFDTYYTGGAYVEAYVFAKATNGSSTHSIPVLGLYGSWTDSSMFDIGSFNEYNNDLEDRAPYLYDLNDLYGNAYTVNFGDGSGEYYFGDNLYGGANSNYIPEFAALNNQNGDSIKSVHYSLIRNADNMFVRITDKKTGEVYKLDSYGSQIGAFYYVNGAVWRNTSSSLKLNWAGTDANGKKLPEGTAVDIELIAAPEYYTEEDGSVDISKLGDGAFFSTSLTIDNTAPTLVGLSDPDTGSLYVIGYDNQNIAAVLIFSENGQKLIGRAPVEQKDIYAKLAEGLDDGVYLIALVDYAGNMSTYKVFMNIQPTYEVESIEISDEFLTLMKNNSTTLTALVGPDTIADDTVTWSSSDETVAIVDQNGKVTAVGVGECEIIATANVDKTSTASCYVEVIEIDKDLNGVVWDEEGQVWFSQFNTSELPEYTKLAGPAVAPINNVSLDMDGTLWASDIDTEAEVSNLYTIDEDFNLNYVGSCDVSFNAMDVAPGMGKLLASYYNYILIVDPATGDYLGAFDYSSNYIVGITYVGSQYHPTYQANLDMYYLLDDLGNLYFEAFINYNGKYYYFNGEEDGLMVATGIECDTPYFQSMYFDGEYTFISNFNESDNCVVLYAVDTEYTGQVFVLGEFADSVWPIAGLGEYAVFDLSYAGNSARAAALTEATINADSVMMTSIEK